MSEVKLPTVGRIVMYHAVRDKELQHTFGNILPAIVTEGCDMCPTLTVFTMNAGAPAVLRMSVSHKSTIGVGEDGLPASDYWDWPEIKT